LAGRVEEVLVREGDYVKRGQVLAWLSSTERAALVDAARARGPEALKRWEELYKAAPLLAPISGQVISRDTEPGQSISQADKVVVLSNRLIVKAQVDETDIAKVRQGQDAEIRLDAYAREKVPAKVGHIAYEARTVNNVTMYDIDVLPQKVPGFMRSGMTANVAFTTEQREGVLLLPLEAVTRSRREAFVLVAGPGPDGASKPVSRSVKVGLDDGSQVEIESGLKEGEMVLVAQGGLPQAQGGTNPFMMQRPKSAPRGMR
jgi:macrolide-specific efflux system membrane fusion protein